MANEQEQATEKQEPVTEPAAAQSGNFADLEEADLIAMGATDDEIKAHFDKQKPAKKAPEPAAEQKADKVDDKKNDTPPAPNADDKLKDILFAKEREAKLKAADEAIKKAREERRAKMTPEDIAKENSELEAEREKTRVKDIELFSLKQNLAFKEAAASMTAEEWEVIAPDIKAFIDSKAYDEAVEKGVDPEIFTADIVAKAKGLNTNKLFELKIKQAEADKKVKEKLHDLKDFSQPKAPGESAPKRTRLQDLQDKALTSGLTAKEQAEMVALDSDGDELSDMQEARRRFIERQRK